MLKYLLINLNFMIKPKFLHLEPNLVLKNIKNLNFN